MKFKKLKSAGFYIPISFGGWLLYAYHIASLAYVFNSFVLVTKTEGMDFGSDLMLFLGFFLSSTGILFSFAGLKSNSPPKTKIKSPIVFFLIYLFVSLGSVVLSYFYLQR